jgi:hypothetical protein
MQTNLRTLGPAEAKVILTFRARGRHVVTAEDILRLLGTGPSARKVIRNLLRKGWLSRIIGGRYMLLPPEHGPTLLYRVVVSRFPAWLHHTKADDRFRRCAQTGSGARDRRPCCPLHQAHIAKILRLPDLRRLRPPAAISTPAKTLVDCLDRPDLCGGATELACITHAAFRRLTRTKFSKPHSG